MNAPSHLTARGIETTVAWFTLAALAVYIPGETYFSWPELLDPFYVVDVIAMALLLWGAVHSLRTRPQSSPGLLCAAYGWAAANGWRSTFWRLTELRDGGDPPALTYGAGEAWVVGCASAAALALFVILLALTARHSMRQVRCEPST